MTQYYQMTGFLPSGQQQQQSTQLQPFTEQTGVQDLPIDKKAIIDHMSVQALVRSYQVRYQSNNSTFHPSLK